MKLKIKLLKWTAGTPVAMLNKKTADKIALLHHSAPKPRAARLTSSTGIDFDHAIWYNRGNGLQQEVT